MNTNKLTLRTMGLAGLLLVLLATLLPAGLVQAAAPDLPPCGQPPAGNWTINASCDLSAAVIAPQNVTITNNALVTVPGMIVGAVLNNGGTLDGSGMVSGERMTG